jgi:hypothetical protein
MKTRTLKLPTHSAEVGFVLATVFTVTALMMVMFVTPGKNGFDDLALGWLFALVTAPIVSLVCVVTMWWRRAPDWLSSIATLLWLPQGYIWWLAAGEVLHYLG